MTTPRLALLCGTLSAAIAVIAGAFGAHALRGSLSPEMLAVFETAVRYQMYHAFAMILVGLSATRMPSDRIQGQRLPYLLFVCGTILFSGSLYLISMLGISWMGMLTPFGGLCFILGWLTFARIAWTTL